MHFKLLKFFFRMLWRKWFDEEDLYLLIYCEHINSVFWVSTWCVKSSVLVQVSELPIANYLKVPIETTQSKAVIILYHAKYIAKG